MHTPLKIVLSDSEVLGVFNEFERPLMNPGTVFEKI